MSCTVTKTVYTSETRKLIWTWQNTSHSWENEFIFWATLQYSTSGVLYWMKQLFGIKTNSIMNGYSLSNEQFLIVSGIKILNRTRKCLKNYFKCMFLLGFYTFFTWDGPKISNWWTHCLWGLVFRVVTSTSQSTKTTCNTTWCCWNSAGT